MRYQNTDTFEVTSLPAAIGSPALSLRRPSERTLLILLTALCLLSALVGRLCFLIRPFDNDAAIFIYMGQMVTNGGRLCHDLVDNKFPTVGLMTSIVYRAFSTCWPAYILLQTALSLTAAASLGRTAARIAGEQARLPALLFATVFLNLTTAVFGGFQLETMQVFFTVLAAASGIEMLMTAAIPDAFTTGLCAGCGMMFKPTAVAILIALAIALLIHRRRHRSTLLVALFGGLCIPLGVAFAYLHGANLLPDMPGLYRQISTYAHESIFDAVELIKPLTALVLLGFPILIRGVVYRRQRDSSAIRPQTQVLIFVVVWLAIETTGVILQRRMYAYHFLPMVAPAALLFGMLPRLNRPGILTASLVPIVFLSLSQAADLIGHTKPNEDRLPISDYLALHAKPGDVVWMDAWPRLVLETGLRPASRLPFTFLFTNYDQAGLDYSATIIQDFERTRPAYIILPVPLDHRMQNQIDFIPELNRRPVRRANYLAGWHRIEQYTLAHYVKETMVGNDAVYHRRGE